MIYGESITPVGYPVQQFAEFKKFCIMMAGKSGILMAYLPPCCPTGSLRELAGIISVVALEWPWMVVLGGFKSHTEVPGGGAAQDFIASIQPWACLS